MTSPLGRQLLKNITDSHRAEALSAIRTGALNLDERDENGQTFLMIAGQVGDLEIFKALLEAQETDINAVDNDNWTALLCCCKEGHTLLVRELLEAGVNIEHADMGGFTALQWASYKGYEEIVKDLLTNGANPNQKNEHHISSLTWAAGRGFNSIVFALLSKGAAVNTADKFGTTPLIWAARKGHLQIVEALLDKGASVDNAGMNSMTALIIACKGGYKEVVKLLLERSPDVNAVDKDGYTALTWASKDGHFEIVEMLLQAGAYVNLPDRYGDSILIHAVKGGHIDVCKALIKKYADVDVQGVDKKTALYTAVEKGFSNIAKFLLESHCNPELPTEDGDTPLMKGTRSRNIELCELMLRKGAKLGAQNQKGDTALHMAVRQQNKRVAELLLKNPKDGRLLYKPNKSGETPYQLDSTADKGVLAQIFGTRSLNAPEAMAGYEVYSSTLATVLSDPTLHTPISVGLYAKWGSGKSILLGNLIEEMKAFIDTEIDLERRYPVLQFFFLLSLCVALGLMLSFALKWYLALGVASGIFILIQVFLGLVYIGTAVKHWNWAYNLNMAISRKFQYFKLLLQMMFLNEPEQENRESAYVRFVFTDNARLASVMGEQSIPAMISTLCDALEEEYGFFITRLYPIFRPANAIDAGKYKTVCCIPYFLVAIFIILLIYVIVILIRVFGIQNIDDSNYTVVGSFLIGFSIIIGASVILNCFTVFRILKNLFISPKWRVGKMGKSADVKSEGFIQGLKKEVEVMGSLTHCVDTFLHRTTRLVVIIDGLDSCQQEKLLEVMGTVHMLFGDQSGACPFITLLAIDPHVIIKGIENDITGVFHDSSINGHDYLRNVVHLPVFLQSQVIKPRPQDQRYWKTELSTRESVVSMGMKKRNQSIVSSVMLAANNSFDFSKTKSYFTDVNPRNMRRLMNIISVTGRLLRAYNIDFSWQRLAAWINITEQWPYRLSWIILSVEDNEEIEDKALLKDIYNEIVHQIPLTKEVDPLIEIDRDPKKLDIFLSSSPLSLCIGDLRKFLPFTINVDPYHRKLIRAQQAAQQEVNDSNQDDLVSQQYLASHDPDGRRTISRAGLISSSNGRMLSPHGHSEVSRLPRNNTNASLKTLASDVTIRSLHSAMTFRQPMYPMAMPPVEPVRNYATKVFLEGGDLSKPLTELSVEEVCNALKRIKGLTSSKKDMYIERIQENNINGMVLSCCTLVELKQVMHGMIFGDWELFKALIEYLKEKEHVTTELNFSANNPYSSPYSSDLPRYFTKEAPADDSINVPKPFCPVNTTGPNQHGNYMKSAMATPGKIRKTPVDPMSSYDLPKFMPLKKISPGKVIIPGSSGRMKRKDSTHRISMLEQEALRQAMEGMGLQDSDSGDEELVAMETSKIKHSVSSQSSMQPALSPVTDVSDYGSHYSVENETLSRRDSTRESGNKMEVKALYHSNASLEPDSDVTHFSVSMHDINARREKKDVSKAGGPSAFHPVTPGSSRSTSIVSTTSIPVFRVSSGSEESLASNTPIHHCSSVVEAEKLALTCKHDTSTETNDSEESQLLGDNGVNVSEV